MATTKRPQGPVVGDCALCRRSGVVLEEGHHYPKFVIRWALETGGRFLRAGAEPNIKLQDGPKEYFLCGACEDLFSVEEKAFAETVFRPRLANELSPVTYDEHAARFLVSFLWRIARRYVPSFRTKPHLYAPLCAAEEEWRRFLLRETQLLNYNRIHLFVSGIGDWDTIPVRGFNQYMARWLDSCIAENQVQTACFVYGKFSRFLVFGEILPFDQNAWEGTRIDPNGGTLPIRQRMGEDGSGEFLVSRARGVSELLNRRLTPRQAEKLKRAVGPPGTDAFHAWKADHLAEVDPFYPGLAKVGRNELCPCGSGVKFKRCHGNGS